MQRSRRAAGSVGGSIQEGLAWAAVEETGDVVEVVMGVA
jgi:hypothetical protein